MGYLFLILTILTETSAVIFMKLSAGFQQKGYVALAFAAYSLSFIFLTLCLKHMAAGVANAIWAGTSTLLVAVAGLYIFDEKLSVIQIVSLLLITAGLIGLNISKANS